MYRSIVILTGAGISADSGVPTFRDGAGLWRHYRIDEVASPEGFAANPELVHRFYNERRRALINGVEPNLAHKALAMLESDYPGEVNIVTQNIDDLHERAGSRKVVHMHGELLKSACLSCGRIELCGKDLEVVTTCQLCGVVGSLRPNVVWFGELPFQMSLIEKLVERCDLFVSIGTSGVVYPAAGLVRLAKETDAETVELNLESTDSFYFDRSIEGRAAEVVPSFVESLLESLG